MQCTSCGFSIRWDLVPKNSVCKLCAAPLRFDSDDFLLHQKGAPGRSVRQGQVTLGRAIENAMWKHRIVIAEAPVGSGKSDSYGVPSVILAAAAASYSIAGCTPEPYERLFNDKKVKPRVVITTAKKNLQHQIAGKDIPFILQRLGDDSINVALLKGKSNYACRLKAESLDPGDHKAFDDWMSEFPSGDFSNAPDPRPGYLKDVSAEDCLGKNCAYAKAGTCGFWNAKKAAAAASVIVTNHSVVAYDLRFGPGTLLPPYTCLVIDEAHSAPASFRGAFSEEIAQRAPGRLIRKLDSLGISKGLDVSFQSAWDNLFAALTHSDGAVPPDPFGDSATAIAIDALHKVDAEVTRRAEQSGWQAGNTWDIGTIKDSADRRDILTALSVKKAVQRLVTSLGRAKAPDTNTVLFVETDPKRQRKLTLAPVSVGTYIGPKLQTIPSTIITSATLQVAGSFMDIKAQLGLNFSKYFDENGTEFKPKEIDELVLPTPFNYQEQAVLYLPRHMPLPEAGTGENRATYLRALATESAELIRASNGNAFILCTSKQDAQDLASLLTSMALPQPLIVQGDDNTATLRTFMATPNSVLLATKAFWEGVDVQGQKLQLVIIIKLPFAPVGDPVLQARQRHFVAAQMARGLTEKDANADAFERLQVPYMLTELRQGAGRLIRSRTDKGLLAILDPRIFTGSSSRTPSPTQMTFSGYGHKAVQSIGFTNIVFDRAVARSVLHGLSKPPGGPPSK